MRVTSRHVFLAGVLVAWAPAADAWAHHRPGHQGDLDAERDGPARLAATSTAGSGAEPKEPWLRVTITEPERAVLLRHRNELVELGTPGKKKRLPPGLAKKVAKGGELPPGWQKKVARGEVMEQDLYRLSSSLPPHIIKELPRQPSGTVLVVLEGKIVRLLQATREILDVFDLP